MRRLILPLMLFAFAACQPATMELTDAEKAALADEVTAVNAAMWDAWRGADFERGMSYFYNSPDLAFAYEGVVIQGYADVDAAFRPVFANIASQNITVSDSRATVLGPDVVCIMQTGSFTQTDAAGVTTPEQDFAYTGIWVRRDGEWKLSVLHESYPSPETD